MTPSPSRHDLRELEDRIRTALRARAAATPVTSSPSPVYLAPGPSRRRRASVIVAGAAAAAAVTIAVLGAGGGDGDLRTRTGPAAPGTSNAPAPPAQPAPEVPRLVLDDPGVAVLSSSESGPSDGPARPASAGTSMLQSFLPPDDAGRMLFLRTLRPYDPATFGLVRPEFGQPVAVRGVRGYAMSFTGPSGSHALSAELPDGSALYLIASGVGLDEVVAFLDGLEPRPDGRWAAPVLPEGVAEVPPSEPCADGRSYEVGLRLDGGGEGDGQISLYADGFDQRLADRVASTVGRVERVAVAGLPAFAGAYSPDDWWVLLEPAPGRTVELRLGASRERVLALLATARFVDEAAWDALVDAG